MLDGSKLRDDMALDYVMAQNYVMAENYVKCPKIAINIDNDIK